MKYPAKVLCFTFVVAATHLVMITQLGSTASLPRASNFSCESVSGCNCPGETFSCQCTTVGFGVTVWNWTLIQGANGECPTPGIILQRDNRPQACGDFAANGIYFDDSGIFTSQMNITIDTKHNGKTVECSLFSSGVSHLVGMTVLNFTIVSLPPPQVVRLSNVKANQLEFSWSEVSNCSTTHYIINSSEGCGSCTNTSATHATCILKGLSQSVSTCMFSTQTVACGHQVGIQSKSLNISLKLPDAPIIKNLQQSYDFKVNRRTQLYIEFQEEEPFTIIEEFYGSVTSYTISYSDSLSGMDCGYVILSPSSCKRKLCSHVFDAFNSSCSFSGDITVTVYGSNVLGAGPMSIGYLSNRQYVTGDNVRESDGHNAFTVVICVLLVALLILVLQVFRFLKNIRAVIEWLLSKHKIQHLKFDDLSKLQTIDETTTLIYETEVCNKCNMVNFAKKEIPSYKPEWGYGYYQLVETRALRCNTKVILKFQDNKYKTAYLKHLLRCNQNDYSVKVHSPKVGEWPVVFIESRDHEENLTPKQKFLFCAPLEEVKGHYEMRLVEPKFDGELLSEYGKKLDYFQEGFGYYEYTSDSDEPKENKTMMLFIKGKLYQSIGACCVLHPKKALYHENKPKWKHMFIHSSGIVRQVVKDTHFLFCVEMDEITTSYCVYAEVPEDCEMSVMIEREGIQDYQERYLYYQMNKETCIKRYKKVILMDKDKRLFTGNGVHHFIGREKSAEKIQVPNFSGTKWTHVFIQSKKKQRLLPKNTFILYCAPLNSIATYYALYNVEGQPRMVEFAKKKIPGFNPLMGYGYYELHQSSEQKKELKVSSKIIMMNGQGLLVGPGAYHYAIDYCDYMSPTNRLEQHAPQNWTIFIQSTSDRILKNETRLLYCEYDWK